LNETSETSTDASFAHLSREDRIAIREILAETKPAFRKWMTEGPNDSP
jgi:hypothetical protein